MKERFQQTKWAKAIVSCILPWRKKTGGHSDQAGSSLPHERLGIFSQVPKILVSAKHVFVSNNTVFGERQAPS